MALMGGPCMIFDICTVVGIIGKPFPWDCAIVDDIWAGVGIHGQKVV